MITPLVPPAWSVVLPPGLPLLNANQRLHHQARAKITARLRAAGRGAARSARIPRLERAYVVCEFRPPDRRRRDAANWSPSAKAAADGALVDAGVLPDDDNAHLVGPDMRLGPVVAGGQLVLHIWPIGPPGFGVRVWEP